MRSCLWRFAVAAALLPGGFVRGQAPATQPATAEPPMDSFKSIQRYYDEKLDQIHSQLETQRLNTLRQFLPKAPEAERESVMGTIIELSLGLEFFDQAIAVADEYQKAYPKSQDLPLIRRLKLLGLMRGGKLEQARTEWSSFMTGVTPEAMGHVFETGVFLAEAYADANDVKSARAVYVDIRDKLPAAVTDANERQAVVQQLEQILPQRIRMLEWIGKAPPETKGKGLDGKLIDLGAYKGQVVLVDFWATWCKPCIAAMPEVLAVYQKYHDKGFEVLGISLDVDVEALKQFVQSQKVPWPQIWDNQGDPNAEMNPFVAPTAKRYQVSAIPATFLIDRDGKISRLNLSGKALDAAVARLLAKPATQPAGAPALRP